MSWPHSFWPWQTPVWLLISAASQITIQLFFCDIKIIKSNIQLDYFPLTHTQKSVPEEKTKRLWQTLDHVRKSFDGENSNVLCIFLLIHCRPLIFQNTWKHGRNKIMHYRIGFVSLNTLVLRSQVLPKCLSLFGNLFFSVFKEVKLVCMCSIIECLCVQVTAMWYKTTASWKIIKNLLAQTSYTHAMRVR